MEQLLQKVNIMFQNILRQTFIFFSVTIVLYFIKLLPCLAFELSDFKMSFPHSPTDLTSIRKFTQFHLSLSIQDLSDQWSVNFLNSQEYINIVKAFEVSNAILLYQTPIATSTLFEFIENKHQIFEKWPDLLFDSSHSHFHKVHKDRHFMMLYYPSQSLEEPHSVEVCLLEKDSKIEDSCLHLSLVSSFDPSRLFMIQRAYRDTFHLAETLRAFLEEKNIPQGESVSLYLEDINVKENYFKIGILTTQKKYNLKFESPLTIETLSQNDHQLHAHSFVALLIREQVPLAFHEASHEVLRRVLLANITGFDSITLFPQLKFVDDQWLTIEGSATYLEDVFVPFLTREHIISYMAHALVGQVIVDVFGRNQLKANGDYEQARRLAYYAIVCLGHSNAIKLTCPDHDNYNSIFNILDTLNLNHDMRQAIDLEVEKWIADVTALTQGIILSNFEYLAQLTRYLLRDGSLNNEQLRSFYTQYPIETWNFGELLSKDPSVSPCNFERTFHRLLSNVIEEMANIIIQENNRERQVMHIAYEVPLSEYNQWLQRRHRVNVEKNVEDLLFKTWTENIQIFTSYPFETDTKLLEILYFQNSQREKKWFHFIPPFRHLIRDDEVVRLFHIH